MRFDRLRSVPSVKCQCSGAFLSSFVQRTIEQISPCSKHESHPPHPNPVWAGQAGGKEVFEPNPTTSTRFAALARNPFPPSTSNFVELTQRFPEMGKRVNQPPN